ncbi:hypothetical protein DVH24_036188 [Malus domestica]|uniref:Uncharacterized protein n=1 Tax=Malus domestica TaxID=3750 RepID=A0A498III7_MALDO|nr:hypothetical protein DVH24_036188 [Malus domestica]
MVVTSVQEAVIKDVELGSNIGISQFVPLNPSTLYVAASFAQEYGVSRFESGDEDWRSPAIAEGVSGEIRADYGAITSSHGKGYKPKTRPCLRPILKKFKKVHDYDKHHDNDFVTFRSNPKFQGSFRVFQKALAWENATLFDLFNKKTEDSVMGSPVLDSDCIKSKIQACVLCSSSPNGLVAAFRDQFNHFRTSSSSNRESNCKNDLAPEFIFIILVSDDGFVKLDSLALQGFDERSHSAYCDFQLGYHTPISDTGGTLCRFTSNVQIKDAHSSKFLVCNGEVMKNGTVEQKK